MDPDPSVWDIYFASLAGWLFHPGYQRPDTIRPSINDVAELADAMMEIRDARVVSRGGGSR